MPNTVVSVAQAAEMVRKDRQTLYNHRKKGKLSFTKREDDSHGVDTAELQRVYGKLYVSAAELEELESSALEPALQAEITRLKNELATAKNGINHRDQMLEEIRTQRDDYKKMNMMLLAAPKPEPRKKFLGMF